MKIILILYLFHNNAYSLSPPVSLSVAPPGINVLEHESIALDVPSSYSTFNPTKAYSSQHLSVAVRKHAPPPDFQPQLLQPSFTPIVQPRELPRQRLPESFNLVTPLPVAFSLRSDSSVSLYRARMENRNVVLRVLNGEMVQKLLIIRFSVLSFPISAATDFSFSFSFPCCRLLLQTLRMLQKDTTSWALPPSWLSSGLIHSCRSCSVWCPCELPWSPWWRSWRTETCSASCGDPDR